MKSSGILEQASREDIRFRCSACRGKLIVEKRFAGGTAICPKCSASIDIPGNGTSPGTPLPSGTMKELEQTRRELATARAEKDRASREVDDLRNLVGEKEAALAEAQAGLEVLKSKVESWIANQVVRAGRCSQYGSRWI